MYDLFNPPPPRFVWAVLLIGLFTAPSCTQWLAGGAPERLELRVQRALNAAEEKEARAARPRVDARPGILVLDPRSPPPPAPKPAEPRSLAALCADGGPEAEAFARECSGLKQAGWAEKTSRVALWNGGVIVLLILLAAFLARGGRLPRRLALIEGWGALRWLMTAQLLANTVLGLWVLYWGSLLFLGFQPGILSIGFAGLIGLCALVVTLALHGHETFKLNARFDDAEVLGPEDAPEFFAHLEGLAERAGGPPPDQLVVGLKHGLFMVEGVAPWGGEPIPGRSLYLHVELLKGLEREELDALLLHELAHGAPGASEQLRSLHHRYKDLEQIRAKTYDGFLSPANAAMRLYIDGVLSGADAGRLRSERAADALAASLSSNEALARALVKATALQTFHDRTWEDINEEEIKTGSARSFTRELREGFERYSRSRELVRDVRTASLSHPQDVHEPLGERLEALRETALLDRLPLGFFGAPRSSWFKAIRRGEERERALWRGMEKSEEEVLADEAELTESS